MTKHKEAGVNAESLALHEQRSATYSLRLFVKGWLSVFVDSPVFPAAPSISLSRQDSMETRPQSKDRFKNDMTTSINRQTGGHDFDQ